MAVYELTLPLDDATVEKLQVGDIIYLNGQVCTARDIAHLKLRELADAGKPFPEDLRGGAIFHAGPVMKKGCSGEVVPERHWTDDLYSYGTACRLCGPARRQGHHRQGRHGRWYQGCAAEI
ncbi:fumarate hydratase C-terminal domain-containing protein [Sutterella wadsworthensis]|uniref:fumarate hydratase C-terminal domain-containing protein n=1 Tax=Sutterella wadsworthensis TaxID=40545 RepID=UPI003A8F05A5